jgi:hypothetical protein
MTDAELREMCRSYAAEAEAREAAAWADIEARNRLV